jgi:hypothetical protein
MLVVLASGKILSYGPLLEPVLKRSSGRKQHTHHSLRFRHLHTRCPNRKDYQGVKRKPLNFQNCAKFPTRKFYGFHANSVPCGVPQHRVNYGTS